MRPVSMLSTILCMAALSPLAANAASVTFNFNNTSKYQLGSYLQPSQVLTPDIGTGQTAQVGIQNASNANQAFNVVNTTFSGYAPKGTTVDTGQNIADVDNASDVFQLTFGHAIHTIRLSFSVTPGAAVPPTTNVNPLRLSAFVNASSSLPIMSVLGFGDAYDSTRTDQYFGTITLASVTAFSFVNLGLFNPDNATGDTFAFDDIVADDDPVVPEPGAIALGLSLGLPALWRLGKARKSHAK